MSDVPKVYLAKPSNLFAADNQEYVNAIRVILEEDFKIVLAKEVRMAWADGQSWKKHNPRGTQAQMDAEFNRYLASRGMK